MALFPKSLDEMIWDEISELERDMKTGWVIKERFFWAVERQTSACQWEKKTALVVDVTWTDAIAPEDRTAAAVLNRFQNIWLVWLM